MSGPATLMSSRAAENWAIGSLGHIESCFDGLGVSGFDACCEFSEDW